MATTNTDPNAAASPSGEGEAATETKTALNQEPQKEDAGKTALNQEPQKDDGEEGSRDPSEQGEGGEKEGEEGKQPEGAPEKYEDFSLPEGYEANEQEMAMFSDMAKEFNLSQEQAQKLIDFEAQRMQTQAEQLSETWSNQVSGWLEEAKADKEIGGREWNGTLRYANAFVNKFGSEGLREVMEQVGLGNHPEVLRAFAKAGRAISEDVIESGRGTAGAEPKPIADRIYDATN